MKKILPKILIIGAIVAVVGGVLYFIFGNDDWDWSSGLFAKREIDFERGDFSVLLYKIIKTVLPQAKRFLLI